MIKKILPILLISSCSYISYGQLPELIVQSVRGAPDIAITDNFLEQQQYSFAKFKIKSPFCSFVFIFFIVL